MINPEPLLTSMYRHYNSMRRWYDVCRADTRVPLSFGERETLEATLQRHEQTLARVEVNDARREAWYEREAAK